MYEEKVLKELINKALSTIATKKTPAELYDSIVYSISVGGKRVRPTLCLLAYNLFKDTIENNVLMPALGVEVFHGFTLIHDDIMDKASVRRGKETVQKKWNENTAILSGDAMCIEAYKLIVQADKEYLKPVLDVFNQTGAQVCEGQQLDLNFESRPLITESDYLEMIGLKTAALLAASAKIGAILGGASSTDCDNLYQFAYNLGIAFQIQDDMLDTYGDSKVFGKTIGGDIACNKKTFLMAVSYKNAQGEQLKKLKDLVADSGDMDKDEKFTQVRDIFDELNVKQIAENAINEYFSKAYECIAKVQVDDRRKENIIKFANELLGRKY